MVISISINPLKNFLNFVFWILAVVSGFLYFVINDWKAVKKVLVESGLLSFSNEDLFIIQPFANFEWVFLGLTILCGAFYIFLMYKLFMGSYGNESIILCTGWILAFSSSLYKMASPIEWYFVIIGLLWLTFLIYLLLKSIANTVSSSVTLR